MVDVVFVLVRLLEPKNVTREVVLVVPIILVYMPLGWNAKRTFFYLLPLLLLLPSSSFGVISLSLSFIRSQRFCTPICYIDYP